MIVDTVDTLCISCEILLDVDWLLVTLSEVDGASAWSLSPPHPITVRMTVDINSGTIFFIDSNPAASFPYNGQLPRRKAQIMPI